MNKLVIVALVMLSGAAFAKTTMPQYVHILSTRMSIVHLKLERQLMGATIEVYNDAGQLITSEKITDRKIILDFDSMAHGIYTIEVKGATHEETLKYIHPNFNLASNEDQEESAISITQGM